MKMQQKGETVFSLFEEKPPFIVSWSHYLQLMRIKNEDENPMIGILLCKENNDALVEVTLPRDTNIYTFE